MLTDRQIAIGGFTILVLLLIVLVIGDYNTHQSYRDCVLNKGADCIRIIKE